MNEKKTRAIVREVPDSYVDALTMYADSSGISVEGARRQHAAYCGVLRDLGVDVLALPSDNALPDCCFTEDTAIVVPEVAVITRPGAAARLAEIDLMQTVLAPHRTLKQVMSPGTVDGGDVLVIGKDVFVGISSRTNRPGFAQVQAFLAPFGYAVHAVEVKNILHMKSACTYAGNNVLLFAEGHVGKELFAAYDIVVVPEEESYAANCLHLNGTTIVPEGYPRTRELLERKNIPTLALEMSEFKMAEGSLTCLSLLW